MNVEYIAVCILSNIVAASSSWTEVANIGDFTWKNGDDLTKGAFRDENSDTFGGRVLGVMDIRNNYSALSNRYFARETHKDKDVSSDLHHFLPNGHSAEQANGAASGRSGVRAYTNGTLIITNAQKQHEGRYICEATNTVGTGLSKIINVKVQGL